MQAVCHSNRQELRFRYILLSIPTWIWTTLLCKPSILLGYYRTQIALPSHHCQYRLVVHFYLRHNSLVGLLSIRCTLNCRSLSLVVDQMNKRRPICWSTEKYGLQFDHHLSLQKHYWLHCSHWNHHRHRFDNMVEWNLTLPRNVGMFLKLLPFASFPHYRYK